MGHGETTASNASPGDDVHLLHKRAHNVLPVLRLDIRDRYHERPLAVF